MYSIFRKVGEKGFLIVGIFIFCGIVYLCMCSAASQQILINEVCSNNFSVISDENENYSDYVEIYNPTFFPVSLSGFSLSDNAEELDMCTLDSVILGPRGYYLVWADGMANQIVGHADFKIDNAGETIYLSNRGEIISSVIVPMLSYNTSYARDMDGGVNWKLSTPTPQKDNDSGEIVLACTLKGPEFSVQSGFYNEGFYLSLYAGQGEEIYYTLDGNEPTLSSLKYEGPILIEDASDNDNVFSARTDLSTTSDFVPNEKVEKGTIVRAIAYNSKTNEKSKTVTHTYFVGFQNREEYNNYAVISLTADDGYLFDYETGIYGNGKAYEEYSERGYTASNAFNTGKEWEREANIAVFDKEHKSCLNQNVGIRIAGESTRSAVQKSFNVYVRDIYDETDQLNFDFWGSNYLPETIRIRNGGSDHDRSKFLDAFLQELAKDRDVSIQLSEPFVLFLNGEYWGLYNVRERYKEDYFETHYGVKRNNVWMIDSGGVSIGGWDAYHAYQDMLTFVTENDMAIQQNYDAICEMLDIQSLLDFYCVNLYINNTDVGFDKNIALWRTKQKENGEYGDGKWRFMLDDLDGALGDYKCNTFEESEWWKEDFDLMDEVLVKNLLANEEFKKQFCLTFMDIANTSFSYEDVHEKLLVWSQEYKGQVIESHRRFIDAEFNEGEYNSFIDGIDSFFENREKYITEYLAQELKLTGTMESIGLFANRTEGNIVVNSAEISISDGQWDGKYYTDYSVAIEAIPKEGYYFTGWSGDIESKEAELELYIPEGGLEIKANFEKKS